MKSPNRHIIYTLKLIITGLMITLFFTSCDDKKVEVDELKTEEHHDEETKTVFINQDKQKIAGIKVESVERGSFEFDLKMTGKVMLNERLHELLSSRVSGRIESISAYPGDKVSSGQTLIEIYSADFLTIQNEFLQSARLKDGSGSDGKLLYSATWNKLKIIGLSDQQIQQLENSREIYQTYLVKSPFNGIVLESKIVKGQSVTQGENMMDVSDLTKLWVIADVFDVDLPVVRPGQVASVFVNAYPHENFSGTVESIFGSIDPQTRTGKMRLLVYNSSGKLKPNMFCNVEIKAKVNNDALKIPYDSVIETSEGHYVFTALSDTSFEKRTIITGHENAQFIEVISGLKPGVRIVTHGTFYLKSELEKDSFSEEHH